MILILPFKLYKMIIVKIKGGLGNQLFQYAIGYALSKSRGADLYLDLAWFDENNSDTPRKFLLHKFNISFKVARRGDILKFKFHRLFYKIIKLVFNISFLDVIIPRVDTQFVPLKCKKYFSEKGSGFDPDILLLEDDFYLEGTWMNENYFSPFASDLIKIYGIRPILNDYYKQIEIRIKTCNSVCVHIRRGDYADNPMTLNYHGLTTLEYYMNTINYMLIEIDNPQFYFFSDDILWVKNNFDHIPNSFFVSMEFNNSDIQEFYLMTNCKNQIIANSTFSWWAAWLNCNPEKLICAPKKWSSVIIDSESVLPANWIVFNS